MPGRRHHLKVFLYFLCIHLRFFSLHQWRSYRASSWHWESIHFLMRRLMQNMNSTKLAIPLHFYLIKKHSKRCCDTTMPEAIHTKDESKRGSAFAFIFGVNWPLQSMQRNDKFHGIHKNFHIYLQQQIWSSVLAG